MIGHLYRYPHPKDSSRFIYVGQGSNRDKDHRSGRSVFGRRFKRDFPNTELPQPVREQVEIKDYLELNELETIWMFQYHTWRGYEEGMNIFFPGGLDYKQNGIAGNASISLESRRRNGFKAVASGQFNRVLKLAHAANAKTGYSRIAALGKIIGPIQGRKNVESGHIKRMHEKLTPEVLKAAGHKGGTLAKAAGIGIFAQTPQQRKENSKLGGQIGGKVSAANHKKNGTGIFGMTFEQRRAAGLKGGAKCVESGQLAKARKNCDYKKMGALAGRIASETGQARASMLAILARRKERLQNDPEFAKGVADKTRQIMHIRWHVKRNKPNPECKFCTKIVLGS